MSLPPAPISPEALRRVLVRTLAELAGVRVRLAPAFTERLADLVALAECAVARGWAPAPAPLRRLLLQRVQRLHARAAAPGSARLLHTAARAVEGDCLRLLRLPGPAACLPERATAGVRGEPGRHSAGGTKSQRDAENSPRSLSFSSGITSSARNERVMKGASSREPSAFARRSRAA